jgi:hypothetical protein
MKVNNGLFSIAEAAQQIGVSEQTLKNWCLWYEKEQPTDIPFADIKYIGKNRMRMFDEMDILNLRSFRDLMSHSQAFKVGVMKKWNERNKNKK